MNDLPWLQMSGAIAGGLVGSFSGFVSNSFHEHRVRQRVRRNIASALIGEIGALASYIEQNYLALLRSSVAVGIEGQTFPFHHFRGDRDYMPVFRTIGYLPTPMPRDLVAWYTDLATSLERAHALHDLAIRANPAHLDHTIDLARRQEAALMSLIAEAGPLLDRLKRL